MPAHLPANVPTPPTQRRAVSVLHLQYWGTTILLTRPFLLYLVIKYSILAPSKKIWFERMGKMCIDAAQKSLAILQHMAQDGKLSSLTVFDSTCILRLIMIFVLAYAHTRTPLYRTHIEMLVELAKCSEQIGFMKMVAEETPGRLADLGLFDDPRQANRSGSNSPVQVDDEMIAQLWRTWDPYVPCCSRT